MNFTWAFSRVQTGKLQLLLHHLISFNEIKFFHCGKCCSNEEGIVALNVRSLWTGWIYGPVGFGSAEWALFPSLITVLSLKWLQTWEIFSPFVSESYFWIHCCAFLTFSTPLLLYRLVGCWIWAIWCISLRSEWAFLLFPCSNNKTFSLVWVYVCCSHCCLLLWLTCAQIVTCWSFF